MRNRSKQSIVKKKLIFSISSLFGRPPRPNRWPKLPETWYKCRSEYSESNGYNTTLAQNQRNMSKIRFKDSILFWRFFAPSGRNIFRTRIFPNKRIFLNDVTLLELQHIKKLAKSLEPFLRKSPKTSKTGHFRHCPAHMSGRKSKIENRALWCVYSLRHLTSCKISEKSVQPIPPDLESTHTQTHTHTHTHTHTNILTYGDSAYAENRPFFMKS